VYSSLTDFLAWLAKTEAAYREAFQHKCKALESLGLFSDLAKKQKSPELQEKVNARLRYILLSRNGINPEDFFPLPEIKSTVELSEMYKVTKQRILDITDEAERGLLRKKIQPGIARDTLPILTRKYSLRSCVVYYAGMMALSDDNPRIAAIFAVLSGPSYPQIQTNFPVSDIFEFKTEPVTPPDVAVVQDALRQGEVLLYNPDNNIAIELPEESKVSPSLSSEEAAIAQEIAGTIIKALEVSGYVLSTLAEVSTQQRNSPITVRFEDIQGLIGDALKDR
jgi:hypothetical protein